MDEILNYYQITDNIGTSGQPRADQFREIARRGYRVVINLAMPDSDNAIPDEGRLVTSLGLSYYHIPVPFDAPTSDHLREFAGVMNALEGRKIWVHCALNIRVSAFMYKYLHDIRGLDGARATSPLLARWLPVMDGVWQSFMQLPGSEFGKTGSRD